MLKISHFCFVIFLCIVHVVFGELSGTVYIEHSPIPLAKADVSALDHHLRTSSSGSFSIGIETFPVDVTVTANGYVAQTIHVLEPTANLKVYLMIEKVIQASNQTVYGNREEKELSFYEVDEKELKRLSQQALFSDLVTSIQMLPGVASNGSFSSQMYIRGGGNDEFVGIIDDIPIYSPYFFGGRVSIFNAKTAQSASFYPGGFDATLGSSLSGVLDVKTIDGDLNAVKGELDTNLTELNGYYSTPLTPGKSSLMTSYRRTYYDLFAPLFINGNATQMPFLQAAQAKYKRVISPKTEWISSFYYFQDGANIDLDAISGEDTLGIMNYDSKRMMASSKLSHAFSSTLYNDLIISGELNSGFYSQSGDADVRIDWTGSHIMFRDDATWDIHSKHTIQFGTMAYAYSDTSDGRYTITPSSGSDVDYAESISTTDVSFDSSTTYRVLSTYIQDTWMIHPRHKLTGGMRWAINDSEQTSPYSNVQPRLTYSYLYSPQTTVKMYAGKYTQEKYPYNKTYVSANQLGSTVANVAPAKAMHYGLGIEHLPQEDLSVKAEVFYKKYTDLTINEGSFPEEIYTNNGYGRAEGLELMIHKFAGTDYRGWLNYTYTQAFRHDSYGWYAPNFDIRHLANLYVDRELSNERHLISTIQFQSGKPYTKILGQTTNGDGSISYDRASRNSSRLTPYLRLDMWFEWPGIELLVPIPFLPGADKVVLGIFPVYQFKGKTRVGVFNVLNIQNQVSYYWEDDNLRGSYVLDLPRMPIFGYTFDLK